MFVWRNPDCDAMLRRRKDMMEQKPELHLAKIDHFEAMETLRKMYLSLTGREPTLAELAEADAMLNAVDKNP